MVCDCAAGGAYPHPIKVIYILSSSYGDESTNKLVFTRRQGVPQLGSIAQSL